MYTQEELESWDKHSVNHVINLVKKIAAHFNKDQKINVIDIGSNTGKFLETLGEYLEINNACLVEAEKQLFDYSKVKFKDKDYVFFNLALYDETCKVLWRETPSHHSNLGLSRITTHAAPTDVEVQAHAFDDLGFDTFEPDLIKIDVEGADFKVILGMMNYLDSLKRKPLIVAETLGTDHINGLAAIDLLRVQHRLGKMGYEFETTPEHATDIFFKPKNK